MAAPDPSARILSLERKLRRHQLATLAAFACLLGLSAGGSGGQDQELAELIRARRIDVVDDQGVVRISLGQDPAETHRRSRACGITLHDAKGDERGGLGTMDDLSAVIALDAPRGVGASMRDRIGMMVGPDGTSQLAVIDNGAQLSARLTAGAAGGTLELYGYDAEHGQGTLKRLTCTGEERSQLPLAEGK